ncbi:alpha-beta hydrolase superfamily lysophospholipase [Halopolyspora algeriensis]|uniref:Alpha-beta hydrolase superfamily lysophospholipase n=1 Tax=Halopolyspora algeriensis TaxID=1500506 RepID=A0A368VEL1_9ACTN|nr:alpha/beta hydrolase [Halopolyspora algeriensis]RCW39566.1 alpha-beta hydrolase superfamily lysophospholipase [Halopolyspora algeriensis]TQM56123.1 alpha-beta hydrolase superfamily lysophospholipase [Halopolyspora algeriensis]
MTGVVLVHGLWHGPQHFDPVARELRDRGITVAVPELHRGSLHADTEVVQAAVDGMSEPPLVLGHSYGGSVITGLAGTGGLVYLAAFVLAEGESVAGLRATTPALNSAVTRREDGATQLDPAKAADALYADCSADSAAWAVARLRPQRPEVTKGVPRRHAWRETPSTYVVCAEDQAVSPDRQREMAERCAATRVWPTGHSPFLSRPDLVVELITESLDDQARNRA